MPSKRNIRVTLQTDSLKTRREKMIVCIAEKPSVARDIAEVLGAHTRKEGYIEGNGYQVTSGSINVLLLSTAIASTMSLRKAV